MKHLPTAKALVYKRLYAIPIHRFINKFVSNISLKFNHYGIPFLDDPSENDNKVGDLPANVGVRPVDVLQAVAQFIGDCKDKENCKEFAMAITHIEEAQNWLNRRTDRLADHAMEHIRSFQLETSSEEHAEV